MKRRENEQALSSSSLSKMSTDDNSAAISMYAPMLVMHQESVHAGLAGEWRVGNAENYEHSMTGGGMATGNHMVFQRNVGEEQEGVEQDQDGEIESEDRRYFYRAHLSNAEDNMDMMTPSFFGDEDGI